MNVFSDATLEFIVLSRGNYNTFVQMVERRISTDHVRVTLPPVTKFRQQLYIWKLFYPWAAFSLA